MHLIRPQRPECFTAVWARLPDPFPHPCPATLAAEFRIHPPVSLQRCPAAGAGQNRPPRKPFGPGRRIGMSFGAALAAEDCPHLPPRIDGPATMRANPARHGIGPALHLGRLRAGPQASRAAEPAMRRGTRRQRPAAMLAARRQISRVAIATAAASLVRLIRYR